MSQNYLITHEVGSLAKPSWRVKAISQVPLSDRDIEEAKTWGKKLNIANSDQLVKILSKKQDFTEEEKETIISFSSLYGIKLLETADLDLVWDGEQQRVEMYEYAVKRMLGFTFHGHVRSFDNKYYRKASCINKPQLDTLYHTEEFKQIASMTNKDVKIPITGAYTVVDWSYDEFYTSIVPGSETIHNMRKEQRRAFLTDVSKEIIYPNIKSLIEAGATYIQIDEPAAATKLSETKEFVEATKLSIGDLAGKAFFVIHLCFSDYTRLFPILNELQGYVDEMHLEFANRDSYDLGINEQKRTGYEVLKLLENSSFKVGVGVLNVHTDYIESPELIRDRILYACKILKDPSRIYISPDCGLRTRSWEIAYQKLCNMVEGQKMALKELGLK